MKRFYVYIVFSRAFFLSGIWIIFLLRKGISLVDIALLDGIFWATIILGSMPGGLIADQFGRKKTLILSMFVIALAITIFAFSQVVWHIVLSYLLWALGNAFSVAAEQAWIYDEVKTDALLKRVPPRMLFQTVYGKLQGVGILSLSFTTIAGGFLARWFSLETPIIATSLSMALAGAWLLFIPERNHRDDSNNENAEHEQNTVGQKQNVMIAFKILLKPQLLSFALVYVLFLAPLLAIGFFSQPWLESLQFELDLIGFIQGFSFLIMSVGYALSSRVYQALRDVTIVALVFGAVIIITGMGLLSSTIAVLFFLLQALLRGLFTPLADAIVNEFIPSSTRATVLSIIQAVQTIVLLLMEILTAVMIERAGFQAAFMTLALVMVLFCGSLALTWLHIQRHSHSTPLEITAQ